MTFSDEERAELIAALSPTADMLGILLKQLDLLLYSRDRGRVLTDAEAAQIREHGNLASAVGQVALPAHRLDDRAANESAMSKCRCDQRRLRVDPVHRRRLATHASVLVCAHSTD